MTMHPLAGVYAASITPIKDEDYALDPELATLYIF